MGQMYNNQDEEVSIHQQGTLIRPLEDTEVTATGVYTVQFTVPTGKTWNLKHVQMLTVTGTYTVNLCRVFVKVDGINDIELYQKVANSIRQSFGGQDYELPAGAIVELKFTVSSYTAIGYFRSRILVQESNT